MSFETGAEGIVYTETTVYSAPEAYVKDVPYQLAIVDLADKRRVTVRILGEHVNIGDAVALAESRDGVLYFRRK